jgi:hypothetical protein
VGACWSIETPIKSGMTYEFAGLAVEYKGRENKSFRTLIREEFPGIVAVQSWIAAKRFKG